MEGGRGRGGMNYERGVGVRVRVGAELRRRARQGTSRCAEATAWRCTAKHTPCGSPTCDSGQWESQEREALISNSVIWLC